MAYKWLQGRVEVIIGRFVVDDLSQAYQDKYGYLRKLENLFFLDQTFGDKWGGLPDPLIVFQVDQKQKTVSVISQEDCFNHDGNEPNLRFRMAWEETGEVDVELQSELNRELFGWAELLIESGYRP